ncbi:hypothetical protein BMI85_05960 [Thioclava sp. DLFJ4-1]|nr:hypothetical protein BMI85_05960 [Thioclava sp. DLFJ4-1]
MPAVSAGQTPPATADAPNVPRDAPEADTAPPEAASNTAMSIRDKIEMGSWIATIIALGFTGWQIFQWREDRKADLSLEMVARFSDLEYAGSARRELAQFWWQNSDALAKVTAIKGGIPPAQRQKFLDLLFQKRPPVKRQEQFAAVSEMANFFDQVELCIATKRCDAQIATDYFCGYAANFADLYQGPLTQVRETFGTSGLGTGLQHFVEARCDD